MQELPLVSVATCSYNTSKFILDTLNSIKSQTYSNIELIIVDDASTDGSVAIIEKWLKTYKGKYKFIKHKKNLGGGKSYNEGLSNSTGKYYAAIDSDDIMFPEKIERQVAILETTGDDVAAVYSDAQLIDVKGNLLTGKFIRKHRKFNAPPSGDIYEELLQGNYIPVLSMLVKRKVFDIVGKYDEKLAYGDYDMWLRIARKYKVVYSDYVSGKYRLRPGSLSNTIKNWGYSNARIFLKHVDAPLPMRWLYDIAWKAYLSDDHETLPVIKEIAAKTQDRVLMATYLLWKFGISVDNAELVITRVHKHIDKGLAQHIVIADDTDINIFLNEIIHSLPYALLQNIICEGYQKDNNSIMLLLDELAIKTKAPYFITARLLWKMGIPFSFGEPILKELSEKIGVKITSKIKENAKAGVSNKADDILGIGSDLFVNEIIPYLDEELLQTFAYNAYANDNKKAISLVKDIVNKNNDRVILTSSLLWQLHMPSALIKELILKIKGAISNGLSQAISKKYDSDLLMFFGEVVPAIGLEEYKKIALVAYETDNNLLIPIIKRFLRMTGNRYFKAVLSVWKFKVNTYTGKIILGRIDDYCSKNLSNAYIDLCLYKDIFGAFKTSNSYLINKNNR